MAEGEGTSFENPTFGSDDTWDEDADETNPFITKDTSTPIQTRPPEELQMKSFHEKRGPVKSRAQTSFITNPEIDKQLDDRLRALRRNHETNLLITEGIPTVENPLGFYDRQRDIQISRDFIKKQYPNADLSKLVIGFSSNPKKPMDIVVKGPKGGEQKIFKDDGSGFQKSFLKLEYAKRAFGESFQEINDRNSLRIQEERRILANAVETKPENKTFIDSLKDKISKNETEKKQLEKRFYSTKKQKKSKSE